MARNRPEGLAILGPGGQLQIPDADPVARRLAMLFEGRCLGRKVEDVARKYGYSRQRYFQVLEAFRRGGTEALRPRKPGPKRPHVRTEAVVSEVIRHKFLDPDASCEVIAQKMRQSGRTVSVRSVQRTVAEFGLEKKTVQIPTPIAAAQH